MTLNLPSRVGCAVQSRVRRSGRITALAGDGDHILASVRAVPTRKVRIRSSGRSRRRAVQEEGEEEETSNGVNGAAVMTRGPCMFRQSDLTRALRAAAKAGVAVRIEFEDGKPVVIMENGTRVCAATDNEWDTVFGNSNGKN